MQADDLEQVIEMIQGAWPFTTIPEANQEAMTTIWTRALERYPVSDVVAVLGQMIQEGREFPPVLSSLIKPLEERAKERQRLSVYDDKSRYVTSDEYDAIMAELQATAVTE
jgi:hypothetical protein